MIEEKLEEIEQEIEKVEELKPYIMDVEIIENKSGKIIELINNTSEDFSYPLRNKYYSFKFTEPTFIQKIMFDVKNNIDLQGMELISIDYKGEERTTTFKKQHKNWLPNRILKEFKIKAPKRLLNKITLTNIRMLGFSLDDLDSIKNKIIQIEDFKSKLNELSESIRIKNTELDTKLTETKNLLAEKSNLIDEHNNTINKLENDVIPPLEAQKTTLNDDIGKLITQKESLVSEKTNLTNNIEQLETKSSKLNSEISIQEAELKKLVEDTNIFSTEVKEYIEQGNKDIGLYTKLSVIPWLLIAVVTFAIFQGSADLSTIYNPSLPDSKEIDIASIFWSRLPFALIVISILFVSYEISKMFIKNIIHIHKQKRIFTKIGVIAKDVADSSIKDLDIEEKDKFELRTKLKMDLLKSHLKNDIGENYEYHVNTSLWEIFLKKITKNKKNESEEVNIDEENTNT